MDFQIGVSAWVSRPATGLGGAGREQRPRPPLHACERRACAGSPRRGGRRSVVRRTAARRCRRCEAPRREVEDVHLARRQQCLVGACRPARTTRDVARTEPPEAPRDDSGRGSCAECSELLERFTEHLLRADVGEGERCLVRSAEPDQRAAAAAASPASSSAYGPSAGGSIDDSRMPARLRHAWMHATSCQDSMREARASAWSVASRAPSGLRGASRFGPGHGDRSDARQLAGPLRQRARLVEQRANVRVPSSCADSRQHAEGQGPRVRGHVSSSGDEQGRLRCSRPPSLVELVGCAIGEEVELDQVVAVLAAVHEAVLEGDARQRAGSPTSRPGRVRDAPRR